MQYGVAKEAIEAYIEEQIFSLPGVERPRQEFAVLLTGSRATGRYTANSDVDIDVVCRRAVFDSVQGAMIAEGCATSAEQTLYILPEDNWERYFGAQSGRPHFSITALEEVARHFERFDDVQIWIWTNAAVLHDPADLLGEIVSRFEGYPREVLVRKIKYRWMLAAYWIIEVFPRNHTTDADILPAAMSILNSVNELLRFFFLVEGKPFPYAEKLVLYAQDTSLGREFLPFLQRAVDLATGAAGAGGPVWERMEEAGRLICDSDTSPEYGRLEHVSYKAMLAAGVEPEWVAADFKNINEVLSGKLGPVP